LLRPGVEFPLLGNLAHLHAHTRTRRSCKRSTPIIQHKTIYLKRNTAPRSSTSHGDQNWSPRSCDITLCDYFLWGYVKSRVYANKPRTIPDLKDQIEHVIAKIDPEMCKNIIKNFVKRIRVF